MEKKNEKMGISKSQAGGEIEVRTVYSCALLCVVPIPICIHIACTSTYRHKHVHTYLHPRIYIRK